MNKPSQPSMRTSVALGALLLLAATATGCGIGMPTQPNLDQAAGDQRLAVAASASESVGPVEVTDPSTPGGSVGAPEPTPAPEVVIPTPGRGVGNGWAYGHRKRKN